MMPSPSKKSTKPTTTRKPMWTGATQKTMKPISLLAASDGEQDDDGPLSSLTLPTLNQVLLTWIAFIAGNRVFMSLDGDVEHSQKVALNVALNGVLLIGSLAGLVKSLLKIDYTKLDDLDTQSLARQAGQWAMDDTIPTDFENYEVATFAGGCFWGTELHYQRLPGVIATCVGYTQGSAERPTYEQVCSGSTKHAEGIQLLYDPMVVTYGQLLEKLLSTINPTLVNQVGNDRGSQYRHGIYFHTPEQFQTAQKYLQEVQEQYKNRIATELMTAAIFWPAENHHQRYLEKRGQSAEKECAEPVRYYG